MFLLEDDSDTLPNDFFLTTGIYQSGWDPYYEEWKPVPAAAILYPRAVDLGFPIHSFEQSGYCMWTEDPIAYRYIMYGRAERFYVGSGIRSLNFSFIYSPWVHTGMDNWRFTGFRNSEAAIDAIILTPSMADEVIETGLFMTYTFTFEIPGLRDLLLAVRGEANTAPPTLTPRL